MSTLNLISSDCSDNSCHVGTTFSVDLYFTQSCSKEGLPVNLTGYMAEMIVIDKTTLNEIVSIDGVIDTPTSGLINFTLLPSETSDLEIGVYSYYVNLSIGDNVYRTIQGDLEVTL
jgi:hypothetical protein